VCGTRRFHDLDVMRDAESAGRYAPSTLMHPRFGGLTAAANPHFSRWGDDDA
jgi:hypothetical protein